MRIHPAERVFKIFLALIAITLLTLGIFVFTKILLFGIVALIIAYILSPAINYLESHGFSRSITSFTIICLLIFGLIMASRTVIPIIGSQIFRLAHEISPEKMDHLAGVIETQLGQHLTFLPAGFVRKNLSSLYQQIFQGAALGSFMNNVLEVFTNIFYAVLIVPVSVFFLLRDGMTIEKALLSLVPNAYFETSLALVSKIERSLGRYLKGVLLQSILVATISSILLSLAGLNNALSVGVALGIANVVPYFGPLSADFLAISIAMVETGDASLVGPVLMAVLITKAIDNVILQPVIFSRSVEMHPLVILFVVLIAAEFGGIFAMLVAVPVATIIKITFEQIFWTFRNYTVFRSYG